MSKAFTKENDDVRTVDQLPDRPVSSGLNLVTPEGLAQIENTIARLQDELDAARIADNTAEIAKLARDLRYWTARRSTAQLVEAPGSTGLVEFGSTVTIRRDDAREQTFRIVGTDEADPAQGTLSHLSPLARALLGKGIGDIARVSDADAEITAVR